MTVPEAEQPKHGADMRRLAMPPFVVGSWAALAYVEGTYNPPGRKATEAHPEDFLGIYVSKEDPGIGLFTFTGLGKYVAFHRCGDAYSTAEFAAVDAFINYEIPFQQWRLYTIGRAEAEILVQMALQDIYERAMKGLSAVLYQARLHIRPSRPKLAPMFLVAPRPNEAILGDESTTEIIWRSLLGEEKAKRFFENGEKLRLRASQSAIRNDGPQQV
jgi:hypothetical protein